MVIGIDLDNVLSDFTYQWMNALNAKYLLDKEYSDLTNYDMRKNYPMLDYDQIYSVLDDCTWIPMPDSKSVVNKLISNGQNVQIVTSTPPKYCVLKEKWLEKNYFSDVNSHLITCQDKNLIKLDVIIDDKIENLIRDDDCITIKFNQPWNQDWHGADYEVDSWMEIDEILARITEEIDDSH